MSNILSAPVTEFAFITLKQEKESERGDLEQLLDELRREISSAKGFHGFSWGKSVDPGKENLYILVLGWDSAEAHWAAVGPDTTCGKLIENKLRVLSNIDLSHAAINH
ncbi:hypothetical protein PILCRDRAFT_812997, partial [Piloderma croceum F 1598]